MKLCGILLPLIFTVLLLYAPIRAPAQQTPPVTPQTAAAPSADAAEDTAGETGPAVFSLIPLLEAAWSGELPWRPDWPADFPPDGFSPASKGPLSITLSGDAETFVFKRDDSGRLREFPWFLPDGYLKVQAAYADTGALTSMQVSAAKAAAADTADPGQSGDEAPDKPPADNKAAAADNETNWAVEFPPDFFPGGISSGGVFPPIRVTRGGVSCFVVIRESPVFLSETWYDENGTLLAYYKAPVQGEGGSRRIQSLQTWDSQGQRSEDYFFDAWGNISKVQTPAGAFSALYQENRPRYWERSGGSFSLQWDKRGFLLNQIRVDSGEETRYEYEMEAQPGGENWVKRQDSVMTNRFGVYVPQSDRVWIRAINQGD